MRRCRLYNETHVVYSMFKDRDPPYPQNREYRRVRDSSRTYRPTSKQYPTHLIKHPTSQIQCALTLLNTRPVPLAEYPPLPYTILMSYPIDKVRKTFFFADPVSGRLLEVDNDTGTVIAQSQTFSDCAATGFFTPEFTSYRSSFWRYTPALRDFICQKVTEGMSLTAITRLPGLPPASIVARFRRENPDFEASYRLALKIRAELAAEELIDTSTVTDEFSDMDIKREELRDKKRRFHAERYYREMFAPTSSPAASSSATIVINTGVPEKGDPDTIEV